MTTPKTLNRLFLLTTMHAVILACGLTLTACVDNEDNGVIPPPAEDVDVVDYPEQPTTDQLTTMIERYAYVFNADYTGEGKAVVARATKQAELTDENLEVVVMHNSQIKQLTNVDYLNMIRVIAKGGTIVFVEPVLSDLDYFCQYVAAAVSIYSGASEIASEYMSSEAIRRICEWSETTPFAGMEEGGMADQYEVIALRNQTVFASVNDREDTANKTTIYVEAKKDGNDNEFETYPVEVELPNGMNDYYFGMKADDLAEWLNSDDPDTTEEETAQVRDMMSRRAGETTLQSLSKAQTFILNGNNNTLLFQFGRYSARSIPHPIKLRYDIWTAYSADKQCDFYCVKLNITAENNELECGPSAPREWYSGRYWEVMKNLSIKTNKKRYVYGPYMRELDVDCGLDGISAELADYTPKNSTSGGATLAESFSFSLGGNIGANASGPTGAISASCSWGSSVSRFSPDLQATVTANTSTGKLGFNYISGRPITEYNDILNDKHSGTKDISIKTCTVEHAWVWQTQSNASTVTLNTRFKSVDEWMTYDYGFFTCNEIYIPFPCEHKFKSTVTCPPRFKQDWAMTIEPANSKAEAYLVSHLKEYFWTSASFWTRKEIHTSSDTTDEICAWVAKSKTIFDKNANILKGAAQEGGITDKYTIRWHQTNGTGSASDDFTYEVKL